MAAEGGASRRVAINAQLRPDGFVGGAEQFIHSLLNALGNLRDGDERYVVVACPGFEKHPSFLGGPRVTTVRGFVRAERRPRVVEVLPPRLFLALRTLRLRGLRTPQVSAADAPTLPDGHFFDDLGAAVVHFPFQNGFRTSAPSIFHPHDLQHLHFPGFFSAEDRTTRERGYRAACLAARAVVVEARWVKNDLHRNYGIAEEKILVIPIGAPGAAASPPRNVPSGRHGFPHRFVLYPAQAWPHKNHLALLEALHLIRERDRIRLNLVCTGRKTWFWPTIARRVRELGLSSTVRFKGYVGHEELARLYGEAVTVVLPSLCEGAGQPLLEAFAWGAPVACSGTTSLVEYAGNAALLFDPEKPVEIADALRRLATEPELRERLRSAGRARLASFSWERSARTYRALYRELAGWPMTAEDHALLREARS